MSFISLASDLLKILQEQASIMSALNSLEGSLEKLLNQKQFPLNWDEMNLSICPKGSFLEVIEAKSNVITSAMKKLRSEQIFNLKKLDSLRQAVDTYLKPQSFRHANNRTLIDGCFLFESIYYCSDEFLIDFYAQKAVPFPSSKYERIIEYLQPLLAISKLEE